MYSCYNVVKIKQAKGQTMTDSILRNATTFHHAIEEPQTIQGFHDNRMVLDVSEENRCWEAVKDAMFEHCNLIERRDIPFSVDVYELTIA